MLGWSTHLESVGVRGVMVGASCSGGGRKGGDVLECGVGFFRCLLQGLHGLDYGAFDFIG